MSSTVAQRVIFSIFVPDVATVESLGGFPKSSPLQKTFSKMDPKAVVPLKPAEIAAAVFQRRQLSRQTGREGSTSLTGQVAAAGQPRAGAPSLLGG